MTLNITEIFYQIFTHHIFLAAAISFIVSQTFKVIILLIKQKKYAIQAFYRMYGGMPSTHTAVVSAVSFTILFIEGVSTLFMLSLFWAITIISDVVGVKWFFTPRNKIFEEVTSVLTKVHKKKLKTPPMDIGHSIEDVIAGVIIAFIVSYLVYFYIVF